MGFRIQLPFPPSQNQYYRRVGNKTLISKRGREYRKEVITAVQKQFLLRVKPQEGELGCLLHFAPPDRRKRDLDNYIKALFDAMTKAGLWGDDVQVRKLSINWDREPRKPGFVGVMVWQLDTEEGPDESID